MLLEYHPVRELHDQFFIGGVFLPSCPCGFYHGEAAVTGKHRDLQQPRAVGIGLQWQLSMGWHWVMRIIVQFQWASLTIDRAFPLFGQ
jgi:hypothetical protein